MPWEHAIIAYLCYSIVVRLAYHNPPTAVETAAVLFASLLPDLIDKPLAWEFNLFSSGHAIGHSLFVAAPVSAVVLLLAWRRGRSRLGIAFGLSYFLHLAADVIPQYLRTGSLKLHRILWPLRREGSGYDTGFAGELGENLGSYARWIATELASGDPEPYLLFLLGIAGAGLLLWIDDGMPIGREMYNALRKALDDR
jgi:hypothetical protein